MIITLAIVLYLWAGATVVFALRLIEDIGEAIGRKSMLKRNHSAMATIAIMWPLVLPVWLVVKAYEEEGN